MSYTPTEWESTDVVTATRMNALETAVGEMNMSYTPNTWSDGDILSAEKMNTLEQAVASGGGGSSDFSTAQVTVVNNTTAEAAGGLLMVIINEDGYFVVNALPSGIYTVPLLNGVLNTAYVELRTISVSGNASEDDGDITITGDCTITIS